MSRSSSPVSLLSGSDHGMSYRGGSVLGKKTILKSDHFPGCQNKRLSPQIEGAPNYRQVIDYSPLNYFVKHSTLGTTSYRHLLLLPIFISQMHLFFSLNWSSNYNLLIGKCIVRSRCSYSYNCRDQECAWTYWGIKEWEPEAGSLAFSSGRTCKFFSIFLLSFGLHMELFDRGWTN